MKQKNALPSWEMTIFSPFSVGSRADGGNKVASVGKRQSSPKNGFSPVDACGPGVFKYPETTDRYFITLSTEMSSMLS